MGKDYVFYAGFMAGASVCGVALATTEFGPILGKALVDCFGEGAFAYFGLVRLLIIVLVGCATGYVLDLAYTRARARREVPPDDLQDRRLDDDARDGRY
jgi:hypothetical protein